MIKRTKEKFDKIKDRLKDKIKVRGFIFIVIIVPSLLACLVHVDFIQYKFVKLLEFLGKDEEKIFSKMRQDSSFLGTAVWTLTTMLAAFIIFYYSSLGYKNYGIPNRRVIAYKYGTYILPTLNGGNAIVVLFMTIAYYFEIYRLFYIFSAYSFLLQTILIVSCIRVTSQGECRKMIIKVEKRRFISMLKGEKSEDSFCHIDSILKGDEIPVEKYSIVNEIIKIPFDKKACKSISYHAFERKFQYLYKNIKILADYLRDNPKDEQIVYTSFYNNELFVIEKSNNNDEGLLLFFAAVFLAFVPVVELRVRWRFFVKLINQVHYQEEKRVQENKELKQAIIVELLICMLILWHQKRIGFEKDETFDSIIEIEEVSDCFRSLHCDEKVNISKIKSRLYFILRIYFKNTSFSSVKQFKIMYEILDFIDDNNIRNVFISYLYRIVFGGNTNDKTLQIQE